VPLQNFVHQVNGPEDVMNNQEQNGMVIMPADHQGINTEQKINNAAISATHKNIFNVILKIQTSCQLAYTI
jgi:hypothetical protein